MNFTNEQRKQLIEKYPYLQPRNVWTGEVAESYDYTYIRGEHELPNGWIRLFLLYCKNIRPLLEKYNQINKYRFSQIKEKYGTMRMYDFGAPIEVHRLNTMYDCYSQYICCKCGQYADYQTIGWIESYCNICWPKDPQDVVINLKKPKQCCCEYYDKEGDYDYEIYYSYKSLNKEYTKIKDMTDEEFYNYLMN